MEPISGSDRLLFWDLSVPVSGTDLTLSAAYTPAVGSAVSQTLYDRAAAIGSAHGITVQIAEQVGTDYHAYTAAQELDETAIAAGLDVGVYFFSQALNEEEAREEAQFVMEILKDYMLTMPVVFDWEHVESETARTREMDPYVATDCAKAFLETIEEAGYWPMMYFNTFQARKLFYLDQLMEYDFWLALYSDRMTFPYKVDMWQYTCTGTVPGVFGDVDVNVLFLHDLG